MSTVRRPDHVFFIAVADSGLPVEEKGCCWPIVTDLDTLKFADESPVRFRHDGSLPVGSTHRIRVVGGRLEAHGQLELRDDETCCTGLARNIVASAHAEALWEASTSVDYDTLEPVESGESCVVNGHKLSGPLLIRRNAILREISLCAPSGAVDAETYVAIQGTEAFTLCGMGALPSRQQLLDGLIRVERADAKLEASQRAILSQIELECQQRGHEEWIASVNAADVQRREDDADWFRRNREARKRAEIEAVEASKHEEWLNRGGAIARKIRKACGQT